MKRLRIGVPALIIVMLSIGTLAIARAENSPKGDVINGKRVYLAVGCFTCHGRSAQGGAYTGPAPILARTALPFDGFKALIRDPSNNMPAYSDTHSRHLCIPAVAAGFAIAERHFDPQ